MNLDFALLITSLVFLSGVLSLLDIVIFAPKRQRLALASGVTPKMPLIFEYARSFFPILLAVLLLRSFLVEPYRIPSGSLEPTLHVGDFIIVNKFHYGLRWPVLNHKFLNLNEPKTGDIVVFRWPPNTSIDYIKRFIGVPGDHIHYENKVLTVNDKIAPQTFVEYTTDTDGKGHVWQVEKRIENLNGIKHAIYLRSDIPDSSFDIVVPKGYYFAMGDNRDSSYDSRAWGFVPEANIVGQAIRIWFSWDSIVSRIRWDRIGSKVT